MEQIVGTLSGIESRNGGWSAIAVLAEGNQYPLKLSTKKQDLIGQAVSLMGQVVTAAYTEQISTNINPNNNQPYTNRYLEAIALGGQQLVQPQAQQPQPVQQQYAPQPQQAPVQQAPQQSGGWTPEKELRITRLACLKVSVEIWKTFDPETRSIVSLVGVNEELTRYAMTGPAVVQPVAQPVAQPQPQQGYEQPEPQHQYPDDDIPF